MVEHPKQNQQFLNEGKTGVVTLVVEDLYRERLQQLSIEKEHSFDTYRSQ